MTDVEYAPDLTSWRVLRDGEPWGEFAFSLAGEYNVLNATAAAALAANYGIAKDAIAEGLRSFRSVKRRLEVKAEVHGITIIDDFAHHPTAIAETLKALRTRYPGRRLWAILEPRSNTLRRKVFQDELAQSLSLADEVVVAAIFKSEAIPKTSDWMPPQSSRSCERRASRRDCSILRCDCGGDCARAANGRRGRNPVQRRLCGNLREAACEAQVSP